MEENNGSRFRALTSPGLLITDFTLDENLPAQPNSHCVYTSAKVDLGSLDKLPLELHHLILSQLDLRTLTDFRRVNRRAMQLVASLPQYSAIQTHARNALRAILSIETGRWITCETLYATICTAECEQCGDFGGYLYILTCKRVCFLCFTQEQTYLPLRYAHAVQKFGLNRQILDTLPRMRSLPGIYSPNGKKWGDRLTLVDSDCARRAGIALYGSVTAMEKHVLNTRDQKLRRYEERLSQRSTGPPVSSTRRPRTKTPFDGESGNPLRFMAIVCTPWFNRISQDVEPGAYCIGCQRCYDSYRSRHMHFRRRFTLDLFNKHLKQCGSIENGKHCIKTRLHK